MWFTIELQKHCSLLPSIKKIEDHIEIDTNSKMLTKQNYNAICNLLGFKSKEKWTTKSFMKLLHTYHKKLSIGHGSKKLNVML